MKAKNLVVTVSCVLIAGVCALTSGCKRNQSSSNDGSYQAAFSEFGDYMSSLDIASPGYDDNAAIDTILNSIINSSAFEGLNNQLTLMGFKNNIYSNELTLSQFIKFDELFADENGNITIETEKGTLKYTKDSDGNAKCEFTSSKEVENEEFSKPTSFTFKATCEYFASTNDTPEHVNMKVSYNAGDSDYISANVSYSFGKDGSLKYESANASSSNGSTNLEDPLVGEAFSYIIDGFECGEPVRYCYSQIANFRADKISDAYEASSYTLKP